MNNFIDKKIVILVGILMMNIASSANAEMNGYSDEQEVRLLLEEKQTILSEVNKLNQSIEKSILALSLLQNSYPVDDVQSQQVAFVRTTGKLLGNKIAQLDNLIGERLLEVKYIEMDISAIQNDRLTDNCSL